MVKVISEVCISAVVVFADGGVSWGKCPTFHMRISSRDSFSVQKYILFIGENFGSIYTTHRRQGARPPTVLLETARRVDRRRRLFLSCGPISRHGKKTSTTQHTNHRHSIFLSLFCLLLFIFIFSASVHSGE